MCFILIKDSGILFFAKFNERNYKGVVLFKFYEVEDLGFQKSKHQSHLKPSSVLIDLIVLNQTKVVLTIDLKHVYLYYSVNFS